MPVREALARLVSEQALEAAPTARRACRRRAGRLADLLQARLAIEGPALELAAGRLTPEDFAALRAANEGLRAHRLAARPLPLDAAFEANPPSISASTAPRIRRC